MRIMYDSVNPSQIPRNAQMVAGYGNGLYEWTAADWALFPSAVHISIDVNGSDPAGCGVLDVERYDASPQTAAIWIKERVATGHAATIYCSRSTMPAVQKACSGLNYVIWVADYTGQPHAIPGTVATQYENHAVTGANYDISSVYDNAWHPGT